jgi:hypothetical protein
MTRFLLYISFSACLFGLSSCAEKSVDLSAYEDSIIRFGMGGGITGLKSEYLLLNDGRIFQRNPISDSLAFICRTKKKSANMAFVNFDRISQHNINAPGDIYYYISRKNGGGETDVVWGGQDYPVPSDITTYWNQLNSLVRTR